MQDDVTNLAKLLLDEEWIALIEGQPLPAGRAAEVRAILQRHPQLAELAAQMQGDREALSVIDVQRRSGSGEIVPPADLLERIEQTMEREALVGLATMEAKAAPPEMLPRYVPTQRPGRGAAVPARWIGPLGLAASLLVAAGGAVLVWQSSAPRPVQPLLTKAEDGAGGTGAAGTMQIAVNDQPGFGGLPGGEKVDQGDKPMAEPVTTTLAAGPTTDARPEVKVGDAGEAGGGNGESGATGVTVAAKDLSRDEGQPAVKVENAAVEAVVAAVSDDDLLKAALAGRLVAVVMPASMQRRLDIDARLMKIAEQPAAAAPVQRVSVAMVEGAGVTPMSMNSMTQQIVLADALDFLPEEVRLRLNRVVAQAAPGPLPGPGDGQGPVVAQRGAAPAPAPAPAPASLPTAVPSSSPSQGAMPGAGAETLQLTMPRFARATTPATTAGIALLRRSLTGSSEEVQFVVLPAAGEGDDPAAVWRRSAGIDGPVMLPWEAGEILWWTAPTQQITPRVVVPVLVTPGK